MGIIKLDYENVIKQVSKIENAGKKCTEVAVAIDKQIAMIQNNWTGKSANAMIEELQSIKKDVAKMDSTFKSLSGKVRKKADQIKAIDEKESKEQKK